MMGGFSPIQSYALPKTVATDNHTATKNKVIQKQKTQDAEADKAVMEVKNAAAAKSEAAAKDEAAAKSEADVKNEEDLWYREQNPMKKEHQKLLWEYCKKRDLNYIDMLALIYTESNFKEKCSTGKFYGYFQISRGNCANLAATLKTKNKPLEGAININWGTSMYSGILADKRVKDLEVAKKRDVALSIYQRGAGGYDKFGISTKFLKVFYKKRAKVCVWFEVKK